MNNIKYWIKKLTDTKVLYVILVFIGSGFTQLHAQGWEFVSNQESMGNKAIMTSDGRIIATSSGNMFSPGNSPYDITYITDSFGNVLANIPIGGFEITETTDKGFLISRYKEITKLDSSGNVLWTRSYTTSLNQFEITKIKLAPDSTYICTVFTSDSLHMNVFKINNSGDTLWYRKFGITNYIYEIIYDVIIEPNGIMLLCDHQEFMSSQEYTSLLKLDFNGNIISEHYITPSLGASTGFVKTSDNNFAITCMYGLVKVDSIANIIWYKLSNYYSLRAIKETQDHGFIIAGYTEDLSNIDYPVIIKTDSTGNVIWIRTYPNPYHDNDYAHSGFKSVEIISGGSILACGWLDIFSDYKLYILKTDNSGVVHTNMISGFVFSDLNSDCILNPLEPGMADVIIKLEPGPFYTMTDSAGYYSFNVDQGNFTVSQYVPNYLWTQNCPSSQPYSISFSDYHQTQNNINFGNVASTYCPLLNVDISTINLIRCFKGYHTLFYSNSGTDTAINASVAVDFGNNIIPLSSSIPWTSSYNNVYTFDIGNLNPGETGTISILDSVSCNTVLGQTECVTAHIYPDSICTAVNPLWDHSSIHVDGSCINDSLVCFVIKNTGTPGTGDMTGTSTIRVYSNDVLFELSHFQLQGGDSIVKCYPADGTTIRLEADQRPGHPGNSHPQYFVENCNNGSTPSFGFIITVPEDDSDNFIETDCQEIVGSFDPNDKTVKPEGITVNHYIGNNDEIEYKINFQNTGSYPATDVVVLDTLSPYLNAGTINTMSSSHAYQFRIYGNNILEWKFLNINLPDSSSDQIGSHGYIKFKVNQNSNTPVNSVIENHASIYFDFNSGIITNTVINVVNDSVFFTHVEPAVILSDYNINIYPNPVNISTTIKISPELLNKDVKYKVFDIYGKLLSEKSIKDESTLFEKNNLQSGIYFIKIVKGTSETLYVGKILILE